MKAFLLAAGLGTRLKPLTDNVPKCLLPIHGKPILEIWLEKLAEYGVEEVLINTHHLADQVERFILENQAKRAWPAIRLFFEAKLLGSGGTVWEKRDFVADDRDFLIIYADNLTVMDIGHMMEYHQKTGATLTMGLFESTAPRNCGIVRMDSVNPLSGVILGFEEKPKKPRSNLANAGIYIANRKIFEFFPESKGQARSVRKEKGEGILDFGHHILPRLVGHMHGYIINTLLIDIGTLRNYEIAQRLWSNPFFSGSLSHMNH
ncbi:MAG: nucleotidyltransferase family protein [bacterium]